MIHFALMIIFAALVAVVFGVVSKDDIKEQTKYAAKVFAEFVLVGLLLAWVLYFFPL